MKTEEAVCVACGKTFTRRKTSNPRRYCMAEKCQKIRKIKNSVASFDTLPKPTMSRYRADIQYHGRPDV